MLQLTPLGGVGEPVLSIPFLSPRDISTHPNHLSWKARQRRGPLDSATGNDVAIGQAGYAGKVRELAVAFVDKSEYIEVITIHPLKPGQKANRLASGRWVIK